MNFHCQTPTIQWQHLQQRRMQSGCWQQFSMMTRKQTSQTDQQTATVWPAADSTEYLSCYDSDTESLYTYAHIHTYIHTYTHTYTGTQSLNHVSSLVYWLVNWCLTAFSAQRGYIVSQKYKIYYVWPEDKKQTQNKTMKQHNKLKVYLLWSSLRPGLCRDNILIA